MAGGETNMDAADQLRVLQSTGGDPALLALATVDLTFPGLPLDERAALQIALEAAAVPHWCDGTILAELVDLPASQARERWSRLKAIPVVESFPARGEDAWNVHDASRLAIRRHLIEVDPAKFLRLSGSSAHLFEQDTRPVGQIEWIFHLLAADPEQGADALEQLGRTWAGSARHEELAALLAALAELEDSKLLRGRALVRARLIAAERRAEVEGVARLGNLADELLKGAEAAKDPRLTGDVYCLTGDVAQARGDLAGAEQAFGQFLAISERLAAQDPMNIGWQGDLAVAYRRVGVVSEARGDLAAAERAFAESLAISERLAALDPMNTGRERDLAVAHNRIGAVAQARGDPVGAEQAFAESLAISERLAAQDPTNTGRQRDLAVAYRRVGVVAQASGDLVGAERAAGQSLAISERLAALDPMNTGWQRDLAVAYRWVGAVSEARGDLAGAERAFAESLAISERLAALDPMNTGWQRDLAIAYRRLGAVSEATGDLVAAEGDFAEPLVSSKRLAALEPTSSTPDLLVPTHALEKLRAGRLLTPCETASTVNSPDGNQFHFDPATYLERIRAEVPAYDELQDAVAEATAGIHAERVLELGVGTGQTSRRVLDLHPEAELVGIDESAEMLAAASADVAAGDLRVSRLEDPLPEGNFDLVVSALAVHHLDGAGKADLFARVAARLRPGGRFVLGDVVVPDDPADGVTPIDGVYDQPSTIDDQIRWLAAAGLDAEVVWARQDLAVIIADSPS